MRVLIVDDDENKVSRIVRVVNDFSLDSVEIETVSAVSDGILAVKTCQYDLMLLDLNLPVRKGELPRRDGGINVLKELRRNPSLIKPLHVIGLTSYDELKNTHQSFFAQEGWVLLKIGVDDFQWEETLNNKLTDIHFQKKSSMRRKILFIAANPLDGERLRLDEEVKKIDNGLRGSKERDNLDLIPKFAIDFDTASQALLENSPFIVHFSGHGNMNGVAFEDVSGNSSLITADTLSRLFRLYKGSLECVLLNACESTGLAKRISELKLYAIGTEREISDDTAVAFSVGFYKGIGGGKDVKFAFELGLAHVSALNNGEVHIPQLWKDGKQVSLD